MMPFKTQGAMMRLKVKQVRLKNNRVGEDPVLTTHRLSRNTAIASKVARSAVDSMRNLQGD
jgi:hypothetical protein